MSPKSNEKFFFIRHRKGENIEGPKEDGHVTMETEVGITLPQAKNIRSH